MASYSGSSETMIWIEFPTPKSQSEGLKIPTKPACELPAPNSTGRWLRLHKVAGGDLAEPRRSRSSRSSLHAHRPPQPAQHPAANAETCCSP